MGDSIPDTRLFDELEFLRFSDDQFDAEMSPNRLSFENAESESLFSGACSIDSGMSNSPESDLVHRLNEFKEAVASCTVDIYHSPELGKRMQEGSGRQEKTLNELVVGIGENSLLDQCSNSPATISQEAVVTSPVSFSALSRMSPVQPCEALQSLDMPALDMAEPTVKGEVTRKQRLKVMRRPGVAHKKRAGSMSNGGRAVNRNIFVPNMPPQSQRRFKGSRKVKTYQQPPFANAELERNRLNAINAKLNRDRKKMELRELNQKCDNLVAENQKLSILNRTLEDRLKAAEEELAFLRNALIDRIGLLKPGLPDLKSMFGGNSAPAGG